MTLPLLLLVLPLAMVFLPAIESLPLSFTTDADSMMLGDVVAAAAAASVVDIEEVKIDGKRQPLLMVES